MENGSFLIQLLTTVGYLFPEFVACAIGFVLLANSAKPGVARRRGYLGIGLLMACVLLRLAIGVYQAWLIDSAATAGMSQWQMQLGVIGVLRFLVDCVGAGGLVVLVVGLCRASRDGLLEGAPAVPTE